MIWPFNKGSTSESIPIDNDIMESLDPSIKAFYQKAGPVKPISLAPSEIKERISQENKAHNYGFEKAPVAFDKGEMNSIRRKFADSGGEYIQTIWEATNENCALLAAKYGECQRHGSMLNRMMSCHKEAEAHRKCLGLQRHALSEVGFDNAIDTKQRNEIKYKIDDLYTKYFPSGSVTDSAKQEYLAEVDILKNEVKKNTYRNI